MGIDWIPVGKPKPEHTPEYTAIFKLLQTDLSSQNEACDLTKYYQAINIHPDNINMDTLVDRLEQICISVHETLNTPRVGFDLVRII